MAELNSKCRSCGQEVIWIRTHAGRAMPCDPAPEDRPVPGEEAA